MSDLISRQAVENITWEEPSYTDPLNVLTEVREKVRALPSVENKGEWIADVDKWGDVVTTVNGYTCSKCGAFNSDKDNYCPNCGAKMKGASE